MNPAFHQATAGPTDPSAHLRTLPEEVIQLLIEVGAPPRLAAHLRAVHEVARQLIEEFTTTWPQLSFDADAVSYGAATHDIGKASYPNGNRSRCTAVDAPRRPHMLCTEGKQARQDGPALAERGSNRFSLNAYDI